MIDGFVLFVLLHGLITTAIENNYVYVLHSDIIVMILSLFHTISV